MKWPSVGLTKSLSLQQEIAVRTSWQALILRALVLNSASSIIRTLNQIIFKSRVSSQNPFM